MKIMNIFRRKGQSYANRRGKNVERDAEIVQLRIEEYWTYQQLANKYGVSKQRIAQILLQNNAVISREGMLDRLSAHHRKDKMKKGEVIEVDLKRRIERDIHEHEIFLSFKDDWMAMAFEDWFRHEGKEEFANFCVREYEDWIEK